MSKEDTAQQQADELMYTFKYGKLPIYELVEVTNDNRQEIFDKLYEGSAMTVQGLQMSELEGYLRIFKEKCGLHDNIKVYHYLGKTYNDYYKTTGKNRYPARLNNISIMLDDMDNCMGCRFMIRWFDDIVSNDLRREK